MRTDTRRPISQVLLSLRWISWFGIFGGFLMVGVGEYLYEISNGGAASWMCLALLVVVTPSWVMFFVADSKVKRRERVGVNLLTWAGTILAGFTVLGSSSSSQ
jgi:hypothetical protein